jgi:hypothetical protein
MINNFKLKYECHCLQTIQLLQIGQHKFDNGPDHTTTHTIHFYWWAYIKSDTNPDHRQSVNSSRKYIVTKKSKVKTAPNCLALLDEYVK